MKYLDKEFAVPLTSKEYGDGWERIFGKKDPEATPAPERRPRGNWTLCGGKYWVSWGPTEPRPSEATGFHILVPTTELPEGWVVLQEPTLKQLTEVIDGMSKLLSEAEKLSEK